MLYVYIIPTPPPPKSHGNVIHVMIQIANKNRFELGLHKRRDAAFSLLEIWIRCVAFIWCEAQKGRKRPSLLSWTISVLMLVTPSVNVNFGVFLTRHLVAMLFNWKD